MIPRNAEKSLLSLAKCYPVVALTGPRQSGKSTLVKHVFKDKPYVSLEDIETREYAQSDPKAFLAQFPKGAILDEVQRVPTIFSYLQVVVDANREPGLFVLTGSQQFGLYQSRRDPFGHITQSLAGRVASVILLPFTYDELRRAEMAPKTLEELITKGLYPPVFDRSLEPSIWYSNYVRTYIERDVRQMIQIRDLSTFQRFVRMCAARTGQLLNLSSLANDCGITHNTAKSWISTMEASFLLYLLKPHFRNFNKRLVKTPKLYFLDPGLAAWLVGIQNPEQLLIHPARGALFETFVVAELLKRRFNGGLEPNIYWGDRTGNEIDIVIDNGTALTPLEIKSGKTVAADFFSVFKRWESITGMHGQKGWLIYGGESSQNRQECVVLSWHRITEVTV
ncbi:MAG: ATP-binding protein [Thaumarchaeota archaeon]|nr:ATP-binding protein [Nitrososphaerota archaeon]